MKTRTLLHGALMATLLIAGTAMAQVEPRKPVPEVKKEPAAREAAPPRGERAKYCKRSPCNVRVAVLSGPPKCEIQVPQYIAVSSKLDEVLITWKLQTDGWVFQPGNGIVFKGANRELAAKTFKDVKTESPREVTKLDRSDNYGEFHYSINVQKGTVKCSLDPIIVNDMGEEPPPPGP